MLDNNRMSISEIAALAASVDARMEDNPDNPDQGNPDYPEGLGDAGKRAIDRMKAERDEEARKRKASDAAFEAYKAANPAATVVKKEEPQNEGNVTNQGKSAEQVEKDMLERLSQGALRSTVREIASSKLSDPDDALVLGNWTDMSPNQFGEFDRSAITAKIDELTKNKPYLLKSTKKFEGSADNGHQGPADNTNSKSQLSREDLKTMTTADINKARADGRLTDILSGK